MAWIKRNLFFVIGAVVALALLGLARWYTFSGLSHNSAQFEELNKRYEELKRLNALNPHPGAGKVDNIKLAGEQQKQIGDFLGKVTSRFARIPAIPGSGANTTASEYASALRLTIDQMQREATNNSLVLPPKYNFSFEAQRQRVQFTGGLEPLAVQLGEVKAICDVLNKAKINSLDLLRRERVSADDAYGPQTDYLDTHSQTNELAVLSPYEITFRCFSPELAAVLSGFANSPNAIVVKSFNVEPAAMVMADPSASPPPPVYTPIAPPQPPPPSRRYAEGDEGRPRTQPAPAPAPGYAAPAAKTGLPVLQNEKQLKVTMLVEVVKLLPKK